MVRQFSAASVAVGDIVPGIVLHLDPGQLQACGARCSCHANKQVNGNHFFLCLATDEREGDWLPLFSRSGNSRLKLPPTGREGHPKWTGGTFYFHRDQVWTATHDAVIAAAVEAGDQSCASFRNTLKESEIPVF